MSEKEAENNAVLSLSNLKCIEICCSEVSGNIIFTFENGRYKKTPLSIENLKRLTESMFESCLTIMKTLMGDPKFEVSLGRFHLTEEASEYKLTLNTEGIPVKHKTWNSYLVELFYKNYIRGIENDYVDMYFAPERSSHWGQIEEEINKEECIRLFLELEESIKPHVRQLASMVLSEPNMKISWQKTSWQKEAMPSTGGDCIWLRGIIQDND
jgi:hypothetical protein